MEIHNEYGNCYEVDETNFVEVNGVQFFLTQLPYIDTDFSDCFQAAVYKAHAISVEEKEIEIKWPIINDDCEEEFESCDWEDFTIMELN